MNFKGGAGKTMIATNIAVAYAQRGMKVYIVDTDESSAATKWAGRREEQGYTPSIPIVGINAAKTIVNTVRQLNEDNDLVVIDGPPRDRPMISNRRVAPARSEPSLEAIPGALRRPVQIRGVPPMGV